MSVRKEATKKGAEAAPPWKVVVRHWGISLETQIEKVTEGIFLLLVELRSGPCGIFAETGKGQPSPVLVHPPFTLPASWTTHSSHCCQCVGFERQEIVFFHLRNDIPHQPHHSPGRHRWRIATIMLQAYSIVTKTCIRGAFKIRDEICHDGA